MRFLVAYDLRNPGRNYQVLWDALRQLGAVRLQESAWYVSGNYHCQQLHDRLWPHLEANDRLLVVKFEPWVGHNLMNIVA